MTWATTTSFSNTIEWTPRVKRLCVSPVGVQRDRMLGELDSSRIWIAFLATRVEGAGRDVDYLRTILFAYRGAANIRPRRGRATAGGQ